MVANGLLFLFGAVVALSGYSASGIIICFDCTNYDADGNYYEACAKNDRVDHTKVGLNKDCEDKCFTRTYADDENHVTRGCTSGYNLPSPLPKDGCYEWNSEVWCVCGMNGCNGVAMGPSSGIALDEHLFNDSVTQDPVETPLCYQCSSYDTDGNFYPQCPLDQRVNSQTTYSDVCNGACVTHSNRDNDTKVTRSCTDLVYGLPLPLPPDGCYDRDGEVWCVCRWDYCNGLALGNSSGVDFSDHLGEFMGIDPSEEEDGLKKCYECMNYDEEGTYYSQCPKGSRVGSTTSLNHCNGTCFIRTFTDQSERIARGCSDTQYGLPEPLPPPGCYDRKVYGEVWCLCEGSRCNGEPMGTSSGVDLYDHLNEIVYEEPDGKRMCYQCANFDAQGNSYNEQCPKDLRVPNAYMAECNGTCFTRSFDYNDTLVKRGCSDLEWGLPDPLPPDGCYTYYDSVWCICRTSRCNGAALGVAQDIELDAHLGNDAGSITQTAVTVQIVCATTLLYLCSVWI